MKHVNLSLILFLFSVKLFAQAAVGDWTDYLSYASAEKVIQADGKIFCITTGGLFTYDTSDNSLQKLNQINGLSDVNPTILGYGKEADVVLVAYANSNLDLITKDNIYNVSAIKRKQIQGDKRIYNILVVGQTAYLSCGFGIVAVNLEKHEIKDTYYIGDNGSPVVVLDMAFDGTYLYAATTQGIYKADINAENLQDFHNWVKDETIPHADGQFDQLEVFNGKLLASYYYQTLKTDGTKEDHSELYVLDNGWKRFDMNVAYLRGMQIYNNLLLVSRGYELHVFDASEQMVDKIRSYNLNDSRDYILNIEDAIIGSDGAYWLADSNNGLIRVADGGDELLIPEGPPNDKIFSMVANGNDLWVAAGGYNDAWGPIYNWAQASRYRAGSWDEISNRTIEGLQGIHDLVNIAIDPRDPDHMFAGTWGEGIFEFQGDQLVNHFTHKNASLQSVPAKDSSTIVRIGGMAFDSDYNLYVTNSIVGKPLSVMHPDGTWESFKLNGITADDNVGNIVVGDNGDQWIVVPRGNDLYVRKADGSEGRHLKVVSYFNNGEKEQFTPMDDVFSIAVDLDGAIWVGTSQGVTVYFSPGEIWDNSSFYANQPGVDLNDGIYHPLLAKEKITAIAVDGANRKWIGTANSGVYLISADGQHELQNFNESNSPLLSNSVNSIAINDNNGEVFFGTTDGIISYRGQAIKGKNAYDDVYAFPNPVREDYHGDIVITGLVANTDVRITDIAGNLVYKTKSLGGQAVWDGNNLNGHRVSTGVYMVFGNDKLGDQTFTTKILFIH
ncbi:MAG TPA: T9SS type A sorting domain-containing protein [Sunxiuqinia sp.]|nr:T9SS type A sorting domain-containing protein [Sunxiuqinia sp.]